jgi:hypothetical protein
MKHLMLATVLVVTAAVSVGANQKSKNPHASKGSKDQQAPVVVEAPKTVVNVHFSTGELRVIHDYYAPRYRSLPPGLQKKLARGGQLPPGWQKKLQPFPVEIERQLVVLPPYYSRGVLDGHAVIYNTRSHVMIDVAVLF